MSGGFTGGEYYDTSRGMRGGDAISSRIEYTSHENVFGSTVDDGKAAAFRKVQAGLNPESLQKKAAAWDLIHSDHNQASGDLQSIHDQIFNSGAWVGDDADQAKTTFSQTLTSAKALTGYAQNMKDSTSHLASAAQKAKGVSADGPGFGSKLAGGLGFGGGDGDGDADFQAYGQLCQDVSDGRGTMPTQVEWQNKVSSNSGNTNYNGYNGSGGTGGVGGVNSPGASGTPQHLSAKTQSVGSTKDLKKPKDSDNGLVKSPTGTDDPTGTGDLTSAGASGGSTYPPGSGDGSYSSTPGLDNGSSLAGYDPGSAGGGLGAGGGAGGGLGGGGAIGGASGAGVDGGLAGTGGGGLAAAGGGLGGGGLAGTGAGGAGAGGAGSGAAGRGAAGGQVAPMRGGGGGGGDESERERSTWLHEDDDVWGESDAPPSVIS